MGKMSDLDIDNLVKEMSLREWESAAYKSLGVNTLVDEVVALKADTGKTPMFYYYFPGDYEIRKLLYRSELDVPPVVCLGRLFHINVLRILNTSDMDTIMLGLRRYFTAVSESFGEGYDTKLIADGITRVAKHGSYKYGFLNYTKGFSWFRLLDAIARHTYQAINEYGMLGPGEPSLDEESGLDHRFHILAGILITAEHVANGTGTNDLPDLFKSHIQPTTEVK